MDFLYRAYDLLWAHPELLSDYQRNAYVVPACTFLLAFLSCLAYASAHVSGYERVKMIFLSPIVFFAFGGLGACILVMTGEGPVPFMKGVAAFFGLIIGGPIAITWCKQYNAKHKQKVTWREL